VRKLWLVLSVAALSEGCYHATIETGLPASPTTIDQPWAHSFLWGLVPPATVETAAKCPSGVAKVETQLSFLNQLANFLTGGIYSPMQITVTCARAGGADGYTLNADQRPPADVIVRAAAISKYLEIPVYVVVR
jgi:hypothetical protein